MSNSKLIWAYLAACAALALVLTGFGMYAENAAHVQSGRFVQDTTVMWCVPDMSGSPWYCSSAPIVTK